MPAADASKQGVSDQFDMTRKLAALVTRMAADHRAIAQAQETQLDKVKQLTAALAGASTDEASKQFRSFEQEVGKSAREIVDSLEEPAGAATALERKLGKLGQQMEKKLPKSATATAGALSGLWQGLKNVTAIGKASFSMFTGLLGWIIDVSAAILAIPFKVFQGLIDMAQNAGGMDELRQAIEAVRKEFGALRGPIAGTVIEGARSMKNFSQTGLSTWQVFGTVAERLNYLREVATAMGAVFGRLTKEFRENGGAVLAYQKALGLSNEQMKAMGEFAVSTGQRLSTFLNENAKYALELGRAFQVDAKLISRDMGKAFADVKHFAGATVRQIAEASVYARKLGVELEKITGTLDTFETFDSAAENAAKLGQSFGVMVDAFELMNAQDPATQVEMLRKQLAGAGVDTANMTRQQLKLLSQTTGLDEATAKMVFSLKNQGVSLDQVRKKGGEVERKQLSQAEAMAKLADSIERLVKSGSAMQGGFFDMFIKGFLGGVQGSREFWHIMMNIRVALRTVYMEGVKLGRVFVQVFPGIKDLLGGLADFFKPSKFKELAAKVRGVFEEFFRDLSSPNGKASFANLMKRLRTAFFDFFDKESTSGRRLLAGFEKVMGALSTIAADGIRWLAEQVTTGMRFVVDLLSGKVDLGALTGAAGTGVGFVGQVLAPILKALQDSWPMFRDAAWDLLKALAGKVVDFVSSPEFRKAIEPALPVLAAVLFGPALGQALLAAGTQTVAQSALKALSGGGKAIEAAGRGTSAVNEAASVAQKASATTASPGADVLKAAGEQGKAAEGAVAATKGWGVKEAAALGLKLVAIAGAIAVGGVMLAGAVRAIVAILDGIDIKKTTVAMLAMAEMIAVSIPMLLAVKLAQRVGKPTEIIKGALVVGLMTVLVSGITYLVGKILDGFAPAQLTATGDVMLSMTGVFLGMVPLLLAAAAIGALMYGPQGLVIGALALGGFAVISAAVAAMASTTVEIVKVIAALQIDSSFKAKSDAFLGILRSLQSFADTFVRIAEASRPSFLELVTGSGSTFADNVDSVTRLVEAMIHGKDGRGGLVGLMETVKGIVLQMAALPGKSLEGARVFAETTTSLVELVRAITPPPEYYEAATDFIQQMSGGDQFQQIATDVSVYAAYMVKHVKDVSGIVKDLVAEFLKVDLPKEKAQQVTAVGGVFSTVSGVLKAVMPSPDVIKSFTSTLKDTSGVFSTDKEIRKFDSAGLVAFMNTLLDQVQQLLPIITGTVLKQIVAVGAGLRPEDAERVKVVGTAFGFVTSLVGSLNDFAKMSGNSNTTIVAGGAITSVASQSKGLGELLMQLGSALPTVVSGASAVVKALPNDAGFLQNIGSAKQLFGLLAEIPKLAGTMRESLASGGDASRESLSKTLTDLTNYGDFLMATAGVFKSGAITTGLKAVADMVKAANALDSALSDGNVAKLNVAAKLSNVAKAVGLGGSAKYTIQNKGVVVHIDLTVTMKADEVEKVIIQRKSSVIRDRLNNAQYDGSSQPSPIPDSPNSPSPALIE